jgi:hypothetical protein
VSRGARPDYGELTARLQSLSHPALQAREIGRFHGHPVFHIVLSAGPHRRRVLLTSGTHGDEPAGPPAVLQFLEQVCADPEPALLGTFEFWVLPCLNPHGYIHGTRENGDGVDINRTFEDGSTPEAAAVRQLLKGQRFDVLVEFHEDWEYEGYYLYEVCGRGAALGSRIVERIESIGPIHRGPGADGYPVVDGVIHPTPEVLEQQGIGYKALPLYVLKYCTDHSVTSETPSTWDLPRRLQAHLTALEVVLEAYTSAQ